MKRFTEKVFQRHWYDWKQIFGHRRDVMLKPVRHRFSRISSVKNDPIVWTRNRVDPSLFSNISEVIVQENGGHCAAQSEKW